MINKELDYFLQRLHTPKGYRVHSHIKALEEFPYMELFKVEKGYNIYHQKHTDIYVIFPTNLLWSDKIKEYKGFLEKGRTDEIKGAIFDWYHTTNDMSLKKSKHPYKIFYEIPHQYNVLIFNMNRDAVTYTKKEIYKNMKLFREFRKYVFELEKLMIVERIDISNFFFLDDKIVHYNGMLNDVSALPQDFNQTIANNGGYEALVFACEKCDKIKMRINIDDWFKTSDLNTDITYKCQHCRHIMTERRYKLKTFKTN